MSLGLYAVRWCEFVEIQKPLKHIGDQLKAEDKRQAITKLDRVATRIQRTSCRIRLWHGTISTTRSASCVTQIGQAPRITMPSSHPHDQRGEVVHIERDERAL